MGGMLGAPLSSMQLNIRPLKPVFVPNTRIGEDTIGVKK